MRYSLFMPTETSMVSAALLFPFLWVSLVISPRTAVARALRALRKEMKQKVCEAREKKYGADGNVSVDYYSNGRV